MKDQTYRAGDLDQTLVFSQEDMKKLRQKNRQPIDQDYFDQQANQQSQTVNQGQVDKTSFSKATVEPDQEPEANQSLAIDQHPSQESWSSADIDNSNAKVYDQEVIDSKGHIPDPTDESLQDDASAIDQQKQEQEKTTAQSKAGNPFRYQSRESQLRAYYEEERKERDRIAKERRDRILPKLEDAYQQVYDEEHLDMAGYNQFEEETDDPLDPQLSRQGRQAAKNQEKAINKIQISHVVSDFFDRAKKKLSAARPGLHSDQDEEDLHWQEEIAQLESEQVDPSSSKAYQDDQEERDLSQLEATDLGMTSSQAKDADNSPADDQDYLEDLDESNAQPESRPSKDTGFWQKVKNKLVASQASSIEEEIQDFQDLKDQALSASAEDNLHETLELDIALGETMGIQPLIDEEAVTQAHEDETDLDTKASDLSSTKSDQASDLQPASGIKETSVSGQESSDLAEEASVADDIQHFQHDDVPEIDNTGHLEDIKENQEDQAEEETRSFVKGTAWLTAGNIISRILGALYVIPWAAWFGASYLSANALYSVGYRSYALFLAVSTAGVPSAIAKQMAYYHAKKEYGVADKLFKLALIIMVTMGLVTGGIFYLIAPQLAAASATDMPEAATLVIRSLAPALLILPVMSIFRGYFQGFNDMVPTAVSQILEQVARIIYMLVATYAIMQVWSGDVTAAVAHSTFAAFIGALLALLYLLIVYWRRRSAIHYLIDQSLNQEQLDVKTSLTILIKDAIPFIFLGAGIIIAQNIDQFTFKQIIMSTSLLLESEISQLFGAMSLDVDKLMMIIISVAVGMSLSSIPLISSLYAQKDLDKTGRLIERIIVLFMVVMLPASLGMASIANNAYLLFYQNGHVQGPSLLVTGSILSIVLGAYTVLSTLMQSMNYRRKAMQYLLIGLLVKVVLQFPLVALWQGHGAMIATALAFAVTSGLSLWQIHRLVNLDFVSMAPDMILITVSSIIMAISASFWNATFDLLFGPVGRGLTFVKILLVVFLASIIYLGSLGIFGRLHLILGSRFKALQERLRMFA